MNSDISKSVGVTLDGSPVAFKPSMDGLRLLGSDTQKRHWAMAKHLFGG